MAPIAVDPSVVRESSAGQRQRWVLAAAVAGVMLTSQAAQRPEVALPDAGGAGDAADVDLRSAPFVTGPDRPLAMGALAPPTIGDPPAAAADVSTAAAAEADAAAEPDVAEAEQVGALPDGPAEVARYGDVRVLAEGRSVELVGFHESSDPSALALTPADPDGEASEEGPIITLPTRGRAGAPTSAIDLAMTPGEEVVAPVDGEVIAVGDYSLYGSTPDTQIKVRPDADPTLVVNVVHVEDPQVEVGDHLEAGTTPIAAQARQLPFESQIDRFTTAFRGAAAPHVHVEMRHV